MPISKAATMQPIFSSCIILLIVLANAHDHQHHSSHNSHSHSHSHHSHSKEHDHHSHSNEHDHHSHSKEHHHHTSSHGAGAVIGPWKDAHATFYGSPDGTIGGACGFTEKDKEVYGKYTTALSSTLFHDAATCGACYEIKCNKDKVDDKEWCKSDSVTVTATDLCPGSDGACSPPKEHFDLSQPAFLKIAERKAGLVPVKYRRVQCERHGGVQFTITGNPYFNLVEVTNVPGAGDITKIEVKVGSEWKALKRNYGERWDTDAKLVGKKLTFRITTSDGRTRIHEQAAPANWQFGQTYQAKE